MTNAQRGGFGRPTPLTPDPDGIPAILKERDQWVLFRTRRKPKGGFDKIPISAHLTHCEDETCCTTPETKKHHNASVSDQTTWSDFATAMAAYQRGGYAGIGFVVTADDDLTGIDLDKCRDPKTGTVEPWAQAIADELDTYTEPSVSGTGLRLFVVGTLPPGRRKKGQVEMYDAGRFFTITGQPIGAREIRDCNGALTALHRQIFGEARPKETTPKVQPALSLEDDEILHRARAARNGALFCALYDRGDTSGHGDDDSAADLALCNFLRFWTGGDLQQMDRLFRQSALMRDKWDEPRGETTYGERTLTTALAGDVYTPGAGTGAGGVLITSSTRNRGADNDPNTIIATLEARIAEQAAVIATQMERMNEQADELAELRAVNKATFAILRSEMKPAAKVAAIELSIEAHSSRPGDFTSLGSVAERINQSDDSVSMTCKAYRTETASDNAPFHVIYDSLMRNPWTGERGREPHTYTRIIPTHPYLSDTLAAIVENIPDELKKKPRTDRGTKAEPARIPDELIAPCPEDLDAETSQRQEPVQVARCDDCGAVRAAQTWDGVLLIPTTENIGSGNPNPHQQGCGLSYLYTDKSGRGAEASVSRAEWVQARIERDRVRRQIVKAQLQDGGV
jgi:primase-polymerase (primpol)-like protein